MNDVWALIGFAFVTSITPGPNNLGVTAIAHAYGVRDTLPTIMGIVTGFALLIFAATLGFSGVEASMPVLTRVLSFVGGILLVGMALMGLFGSQASSSLSVPHGFGPGFLFQFFNPKGWLMATGAVSVFGVDAGVSLIGEALVITALFAAVMLPSVSAWALFGSGMSSYLKEGGKAERTVSACTLAVLAIMGVAMVTESIMMEKTSEFLEE